MDPADLIRIAELIRLAVEAGCLFSDSRFEGDGRLSRIIELCAQTDIAAIELGEIGNRMVAEQAITHDREQTPVTDPDDLVTCPPANDRSGASIVPFTAGELRNNQRPDLIGRHKG